MSECPRCGCANVPGGHAAGCQDGQYRWGNIRCDREVLRAELDELRREHDATPPRQTARRVGLARRLKDAERELEQYDRRRAAQIGGAS
jgi:hypothetical protein